MATLKLTLPRDGDGILLSTPYNPSLNQSLRAMGGVWQANSKQWLLPSSKHDALVDLVSSFPEWKVSPLPDWVRTAAASPMWNTHTVLQDGEKDKKLMESVLKRLPKSAAPKLKAYQLRGILCAVERGGRVLWGDEMGLGKTVQALMTCCYYQHEWPLLIICPSSLKLTWVEEIRRWCGLDPELISVLQTGNDAISGLVTIVSYDLAQRLAAPLNAAKFKVIVCDEAHFLKNDNAKRTQIIVPLVQAAKRALLLTGTPALSRPIELHQLLTALWGPTFPNKIQFGQRYCSSRMTKFGWQHFGSCNEAELNGLMLRTFLIRRSKAEVLSDLPPKTRQTLIVECSKAMQIKIAKEMSYKRRLEVELATSNGETRKVLENKLQGVRSNLYGLTGEAKLPAVLSVVEDHLDKGIKMLVFAHHKKVLDEIMVKLTKRKVQHIRIDGATPTHLRQSHCNAFQTNPNCQVALLSMTAAGTGLTLTAAECAIFAELAWNPGTMTQAEDRAHRIGQQKSVFIKYILCKDTYDDDMWELAMKKNKVLGKAVRGDADDEGAEADAMDGTPPTLSQTSSAFASAAGQMSTSPRRELSSGARGEAGPASGGCGAGPGSATDSELIECPTCESFLPGHELNSHLDACAASSQRSSASLLASPGSPQSKKAKVELCQLQECPYCGDLFEDKSDQAHLQKCAISFLKA